VGSTSILLVSAFCKVCTCVQVLTCQQCVRPTVTFTELLDGGLVRPKYVAVRLLIFDYDLRRLCT
jgi:hypothetical protein